MTTIKYYMIVTLLGVFGFSTVGWANTSYWLNIHNNTTLTLTVAIGTFSQCGSTVVGPNSSKRYKLKTFSLSDHYYTCYVNNPIHEVKVMGQNQITCLDVPTITLFESATWKLTIEPSYTASQVQCTTSY